MLAPENLMLAQGLPPWWLLQHVPWAVFVFCFGACVGSFLNVVIYRLPAGISVVSPPSRCPVCGGRLSWRENLPILGWLWLRGRCRRCGVPISSQYMLIELGTALMFLGFYVVLFTQTPHPGGNWWSQIGGLWWYYQGPFRALPAFLALMFLYAGLLAMTVIDARSFTIPLPIPVFVTIAAALTWAIQPLIPPHHRAAGLWPIHTVGWAGFAMAMGGMLGLTLSMILLKSGKLRQSFSDYASFLPPGSQEQAISTDRATPFELVYALPCVIGLACAGFGWPWALGAAAATSILMLLVVGRGGKAEAISAEPEADHILAAEYPHARREMLVELVFVLPCILGMVGGWLLGRYLPAAGTPLWVQSMGGCLAGYLVGGGLVWGIRILGTLGFGREAMGMGDVHLLGAVGAVLGWFDSVLVFFLAPFFAIGWVVLTILLSRVLTRMRREIPYGPHLALAALAIVLCRPGVNDVLVRLFPFLPSGLIDRTLQP